SDLDVNHAIEYPVIGSFWYHSYLIDQLIVFIKNTFQFVIVIAKCIVGNWRYNSCIELECVFIKTKIGIAGTVKAKPVIVSAHFRSHDTLKEVIRFLKGNFRNGFT